MALVFCCGFECGLSGGATPHFSSNAVSPIQTTTKRSGARALRINSDGSLIRYATYALAAGTIQVGRVYVRFGTLPAADVNIIATITTADTGPAIRFKASDSKLYTAFGTTFGSTGVAVTTGIWYRIDYRFNDSNGITTLIDMQVDGTAVPQQTGITTFATTDLVLGLIKAVSGDVYFDDVAASVTSADYPIGSGKVEHFVPVSDGTHNTGNTANAFEDQAGNDYIDSTTTSWQKVSKVPLPSAVDASNYIRYVLNTGVNTRYLEHVFGPASGISTPTTGPRFVDVMCLMHEAATGACDSTWKINDNGTEDTVIARGVTAGQTTLRGYRKGYATMPGGGGAWTHTRFNNLRSRLGYVSDANPDVYWDAIMIEAEFLDSANTTTDQTRAGTARIQKVQDVTRAGTSRIQKAFDVTRTGAARVQKVFDATRVGLARIQKVIDATRSGLASIRGTTDRTRTGIARIQKAADVTRSGAARIQKVQDVTRTGVARVTAAVDKTRSGTARLQTRTDATTTGISRIVVQTSQTRSGLARLQKVFDAVRSGTARLQKLADATRSGLARIQAVSDKTRAGTSRIQAVEDVTAAGLASIRNTTDRTRAGTARVQKLTDVVLSGLARVQKQADAAIAGIALISATIEEEISGTARVQKVSDVARSGLSRIQATVSRAQTGSAAIVAPGMTTQSITGLAAIRATTNRTVAGLARLRAVTDNTRSGTARISKLLTVTNSGTARVQAATSQTRTGLARIRNAADVTRSGLARIRATQSVGISGLAKIATAGTEQTVFGQARVTALLVRTATGNSRIAVETERIAVGLARIIAPLATPMTGPTGARLIDRGLLLTDNNAGTVGAAQQNSERLSNPGTGHGTTEITEKYG